MDDDIFVKDTIASTISQFDSIIFDCDGVLIDVTNSYDTAIQRTAAFILKEVCKIPKFDPVTSQMIDSFKETGGFNDEVDLTYAAILSLTAANRLNKKGKDFVFKVIENADETGIKSVEKYLDSLKVNIADVKQKLNYPSKHSENFLYSTFDQIFYGPELYQKLFDKKSNFTEDGLIENDVVLVKKELLEQLKKKFEDKIAIVTGRGIESIRYSLKELFDEFNTKSSVFLEGESRDIAKPNPKSLIRAITALDSSHCLYVGDSMEDYMMAQKATQMGFKTTFCGIFGTSKFPEQRKKFFEEKKVDMLLKSIEMLPKALNLV